VTVLLELVQKDFGHWLKALLKARGLEQKHAAELLGIAESTMSMIISGDRPPTLELIPRWAVVLCETREERERFIELGYLTHCPEWIVREYLRMKTKLTEGA
jgi:transcriptional regulator with XRE-family HTH domain